MLPLSNRSIETPLKGCHIRSTSDEGSFTLSGGLNWEGGGPSITYAPYIYLVQHMHTGGFESASRRLEEVVDMCMYVLLACALLYHFFSLPCSLATDPLLFFFFLGTQTFISFDGVIHYPSARRKPVTHHLPTLPLRGFIVVVLLGRQLITEAVGLLLRGRRASSTSYPIPCQLFKKEMFSATQQETQLHINGRLHGLSAWADVVQQSHLSFHQNYSFGPIPFSSSRSSLPKSYGQNVESQQTRTEWGAGSTGGTAYCSYDIELSICRHRWCVSWGCGLLMNFDDERKQTGCINTNYLLWETPTRRLTHGGGSAITKVRGNDTSDKNFTDETTKPEPPPSSEPIGWSCSAAERPVTPLYHWQMKPYHLTLKRHKLDFDCPFPDASIPEPTFSVPPAHPSQQARPGEPPPPPKATAVPPPHRTIQLLHCPRKGKIAPRVGGILAGGRGNGNAPRAARGRWPAINIQPG
eukprot:gene8001-5561_t